MEFKEIFINFTQGKFDIGEPHTEKLKEWHEAYKKELKGQGCPPCRRRRVNVQYKNKIQKLLASDDE